MCYHDDPLIDAHSNALDVLNGYKLDPKTFAAYSTSEKKIFTDTLASYASIENPANGRQKSQIENAKSALKQIEELTAQPA